MLQYRLLIRGVSQSCEMRCMPMAAVAPWMMEMDDALRSRPHEIEQIEGRLMSRVRFFFVNTRVD